VFTLSYSSISIGPLLEVSWKLVNEFCRLGAQNIHHSYALDWLVVPRTNSCFERIRSIMANENPSHFWLAVLIFVYEGTWLSECMKAHGSPSVIERGKYRACPIHLSSLFTSSGTHAAGTEDAFLAENTGLDSCSPLYLSLSSGFKQPQKPVRPRSVSTMHRFLLCSCFPPKFKFATFLIKSNDHMLQIDCTEKSTQRPIHHILEAT